MNSLFYVGMDVHKESISLAVIRDNNRTIEFERQIKNEPSKIKKFFTQLKEKSVNIICCYEAGPTGYVLYRQLEEMNIACHVAAPSMLPRKPGDKIKTDSRDAVLLAKALRNQEIVNVYIPTRSDEAVRDYLRMCNDMRKDLKRHKQRMMQFLLRQGKRYPTSNRYWTGIFHKWMKTLTFEEDIHQEVFNEYYTAILELEAKIERINERIEELGAEARYAEKVAKLKCLKGISTLSALTFVVEIGDFRRFSKAAGFMAYMGLVPSEYSSGEMRKQGRITKAGNTRLRMLLIEAGWHYRHYGPSQRLSAKRKGQSLGVISYADKAGIRLNRKFQRLSQRGKTKQKIVTAVARELAGFIWGMMVGKTELA